MLTKKELQQYLDSMSKKDVAAELEISQSTLNRWMKVHGLCRKGWGPGKLSYEKAQEIRKLYSSGKHTQESLAEKMKVCQSTINKIINNTIYKEKFLSGKADVKVNIKF